MTRKERLLLKVMEECDELSQRCSKALMFTLEEIQPDDKQNPFMQTNARRIIEEYKDLVVAMQMLLFENNLPYDFTPKEASDREKRIERFMAYSKSIGTLTD